MSQLSRHDFFMMIKNRIEGARPHLVESLYYLDYFDQLENWLRFIRWNWAAFFWDGAWMFYRRMFAYGTFVLILNILFFFSLGNVLANQGSVYWQTFLPAYVGLKVLLGVFGNLLYTVFIRRSLKAGRVPGSVEGTSLWAYLLMILAAFILGLLKG